MCCLHGATTSTTSSLRDVALAFAWRSTRIGAEEVLHTLTVLLEMVPEGRNHPEPVVNNQQYPFSAGVDNDRSRSENEDSVETKISNSDDDRIGARKTSHDLAVPFRHSPKQLHFSGGKTNNMTVNSSFLQYHHRSKSTW